MLFLRFFSIAYLLFCVCNFSYAQHDPFSPKPATKSALQVQNATNIEASVADPSFENYIQDKLYATAQHMDCSKLLQLSMYSDSVVILDARDRSEYNISHIERARRVGYEDFTIERVWMLERDAIIVVYCSIGDRSCEIAARLTHMGFKKVYNLYGGLVEWTNKGGVVVDKSMTPTKQVALPSKQQGKFLKKGKAVFE